MTSTDIKQAAHQLIDQHEHLTWADLAYQATLKASIEQGLKEAKAGQLISQEEIEKEFGLNLTNESGLLDARGKSTPERHPRLYY